MRKIRVVKRAKSVQQINMQSKPSTVFLNVNEWINQYRQQKLQEGRMIKELLSNCDLEERDN